MSPSPSPLDVDSSRFAFLVKVDGVAIPEAYQVVSIDTWNAVNKVPRARLVLFDGSPAEEDFEVSSGKTFVPGGKLEISAGYGEKRESNPVIFQGIVVGQGLEVDPDRGSKLVVEAAAPALRMTLERKNGLFEKVKDSQLITDLARANKLSATVEATKTVHPEIVQYYATDWDLAVMRAELNGYVVITDGDKLKVGSPDTGARPVLALTYGESILDLRADLDATHQLSSKAVKSVSWDPSQQKVVSSGPGAVQVDEPGNLSSETLSKVFGVRELRQQTGGPLEKSSLQAWSSGELLKSRLSKVRGWVRFQGSHRVKTGTVVQLAGLGSRFNGPAWASGVHHHVESNRWLTTVDFGLSPRWFAAEAPDVAAPEASGQLPPIQGLQTGVVKKVAKDPGGEHRVLVSLPLLQAGDKAVWARIATFYASKQVGAFFYPEVGDEVVVGFMNDDPRFPVILGSVWSKKLPPPLTPGAGNDRKTLVTRSKLEISFDDKDKILEIRTPGKHVLKMDDKSGAISIKDSNGNTLSLSKGGIALDSKSNVKITAKGTISIEGANVAVKAKAKASMEGGEVAHKAKGRLSAQANGMAELKASGILTVRGSLVKIN